MREELKSYVARHGLVAELEEPVKDILQVYDIVEDFEKLKISPEPSQQQIKSDKAARTATNVSPNGNLKPRSLNSEATETKVAGKKENIQKAKPDARVRGSYNKNPAKNTAAKEVVRKNASKKTKKQAKGQQEVSNGDSEASAARPDQEPGKSLFSGVSVAYVQYPVYWQSFYSAADVVMEIAHEDKENMVNIWLPIEINFYENSRLFFYHC